MSHLRLSPSASITPTRDAVILRSDLGSFSVAGADIREFLERIVPLLDGSHDQKSIEEALSSYSPKSVGAFLDVLRKRGLVEETADAPSDEDRFRGQEAFLQKCGARVSIRGARVAFANMDSVGSIAALALAASGLGVLDLATPDEALAAKIRAASPWCSVETRSLDSIADNRPTVILATIAPADTEAVARVSKLAHAAGIQSLWAHVAGTTSILGPLVVPGFTACRICATEGALSPAIPEESSPEGADILGTALALEAIKAITQYAPSSLAGRMLVQDLQSFETRMHTLVRLPWCRVCGENSGHPR